MEPANTLAAVVCPGLEFHSFFLRCIEIGSCARAKNKGDLAEALCEHLWK